VVQCFYSIIIHTGWMANEYCFNSSVNVETSDAEKSQLKHAQRLNLNGNYFLPMRLFAETAGKGSMLARFCWYVQGIVYVDKETVGWRSLAKTWLSGRPSAQSRVSSQ
jgi:hypothetical protein